MVSMSRGTFLKGAVLSAAAVALAGCSTGSKDSKDSGSGSSASADPNAFPATVQHAYGETKIESEPKKVVGIGWINAEVALSLGVVPIGSGQVSWGENSNHSTDWFDKKLKDLGGEQPTRFAETDGTNFEEIAKLSPDLILAVVGTVSKEDYDKLSKIAPTVVHAKDSDGWDAPWQDYTTLIGKALGREDEVKKVIDDTEKKIKDAAAKHSQLEGATFISSALAVTKGEPSIAVYTKGDGRVTFMKSLGLKLADSVANAKSESFYMEWSNERASELKSDMIYSWVEKESDIQAIKDNDVLKQIPAVSKDAAVLDANKQEALGVGLTPLGMNWLVDETDFVSKVADAVTNGKK